MKTRIFNILLVVVALAGVLTGCKSRKALLPNISGKAGEVVVVMRDELWKSELGAEVRKYFAADCEFLPQKEPLYDLVNVIPAGFNNLFKVHRNIVIFNIDSSVTEPGVVYRNDVWATPQCVISVNAIDVDSAIMLLDENVTGMLAFVEQAERERIIANSVRYREPGVEDVVCQMIGGSPVFPSGYRIKKKTDNFIWVGYETTYTNQGILIYRYPATDNAVDFQLEDIVWNCDQVLKENVPGMFEGTYMMTSTFATPKMEYVKYKGRNFAALHGLWEVNGDFMGGPFVSHVFYSKDGKEMIVLQGFVYAPKYDKRHYLRQVESILYSYYEKKVE